MSEQNIESRIIHCIAEQLGAKEENIIPASRLVEDLGADSLDTVELIMALEEEFSTEIPDQEAEELETVGAIIDYIKQIV